MEQLREESQDTVLVHHGEERKLEKLASFCGLRRPKSLETDGRPWPYGGSQQVEETHFVASFLRWVQYQLPILVIQSSFALAIASIRSLEDWP